MVILEKYRNLSSEIKAGLWFTLCNLLQRSIGFITMPIFTRIMSQDNYGMFSTYMSWYSFLLIFSSLNLSSYVFNKGMIKYEDDRDNLQVSLQGLGFVITIILFIIYWLFKDFFNKFTGLSTVLMLYMFIHMFFEPPILLWTARQRFEYKYIAVIIVTIFITIFNPLIGILAVKNGNNQLLDRAFADMVVPLIFGLIISIYMTIKSRTTFSIKYWKYALLFNLPLIPHFLSTVILNQADRIMITNITGSRNTALYSVAYTLGMVTTLFTTAIQQSLLPWLYTKLKNKNYYKIKEVTNITVIVVFVICLLLVLVAPDIMMILAPISYANAIWVIPPVCTSVFFIYIYNLFANIEYYFEETKYVAIASIMAAFLNCGLNYIFIRLYGFVAAGYTTLFCYIVLAYMHFVCMRKICKKYQFNEEIFDYRFILILVLVFLFLILSIVFLYKLLIIRYLLFSIIVIVVFIYREKIKQNLGHMKG